MSKLIGIILGVVFITGGVWLNTWSRRELRAQAERVAAAKNKTEAVRAAAAANEEVRALTDGYVRELQCIIRPGILSPGQVVEAEYVIRKWKAVSGDLEVHIDKKTQMVYGFDSSVVKKLRSDKENRIRELETEAKLLEAESIVTREYVKIARDFWHTVTPVIILLAVGALFIIAPFFFKKK